MRRPSEYCGKSKMTPSLTSYLGTRTLTPTRRIQRNHSWLSGKKKINTSTVIISMSNDKKISIPSFCLWDTGKGGPGRAIKFESNHGWKME